LPFDEDDLAALRVLATLAAATIDRAQSHWDAERQRDRFRVILDNLPSGVFILAAPAGEIEFANAALIELVFGPGAPAGTLPVYGRDFDFLRADGVPLLPEERPAVRALRGEPGRHLQLLLRRAARQEIPVDVHTATLRDAAGNATHAVAVVQNATSQREAEQLKDDFLALISHEFRTPLTAIHGGAHLLANGGDALDAETRQEILADVVTESDRLDRLLGNLVGLASLMAGRLQAATEPVLLAPLLRPIAAEAGRRSPAHTFIVDLAVTLPPIEADPGLLEEVVRNLYENAVKYAPDGGEVRTTAERQGDAIAIHVIDRGIGIAPEHVEGVFERFRRPGAPTTTRGMGLGLYLSRHLVGAQGGRIEAASAGVGLGTTFTITLPIARGWIDSETA
jgi:K+-sensing histidine kinase KdpD